MLDDIKTSEDLLSFVRESPSSFHTVASVRKRLDAAGFAYLPEHEAWHVERGGSYYTCRNGSSVVAFRVGEHLDDPYCLMSAAHADSPTFKVKAEGELVGPGDYLRLNVDPYGGMIDYTWFDRPLSVAGRVMVRDGNAVQSRLLYIDRDILLIPSLAIHMNRDVNQGFAPNRQVDLCPLFSAGELKEGAFREMVAGELGASPADVLGYELVLVNRQPGVVWGAQNEFVSSGHLDDLQSAYSCLQAFVGATNEHAITVYACFDNEEVGSLTKQGARSTLLRDTLERMCAALGLSHEDYLRALASSMLVSCDNAHALHPNHPEHADERNRPRLNGGVVIKEHAAQLYTTDAFSRAVFVALCERAGVPYQLFANRSDKRGGSTLGNLSNAQVSVNSLDIGLPQLAMHSAYETAGVRDTAYGIRALSAFYEADLKIEGTDRAVLTCS